MEVSQFTYFQQAGGLECLPITGEITYGIERLAMYLQDVDSVYELVWSETPTGTIEYGDVFHQNEVEMSTFNFQQAELITCSAISNFAKRKLSDWFPSNCHFRPMSL